MRSRRVALGVGANIVDKLIIAGVQLTLVPVLATHWGLATYGGWVLLASIPSFLAVSDLGFATAAGNRMTMLAARGEREQVVRTFQSAWAVILASSTTMLALVLLAAWYVPAAMLPTAADFTVMEARLTLMLLMTYGLVCLQGSIFSAGFRCAGLFPVGTLWMAMTVLAENVAAITVVLLGARPVTVAVALLVSRFLALIIQNLLLRRMVPWLRVGLRHADRTEARGLLPPALAVVALPLAQASFLQGTAIALGAAVSQAAVPAFTATRTLSRIGLQFTQLLNHALMPEYSAAVAREDRKGQAVMLLLTLLLAAAVVVPFALVLAIFGPQLVALWTKGVIHPSQGLMLAMAASVVLGGFWTPVSNLLLAMNRHAGYSYAFVIGAIATVPLSYLLSEWLGAAGAGLAIALLDLMMCVVIVRIGRGLFVSGTELRDAGRGLHSTVGALVRRRLRR